ncbi:hypothetical protein JW935_03945, partial [candidate division KSB1 bacterium]|nr:hypothetical protein [candidate division KSB1 bacterium]
MSRKRDHHHRPYHTDNNQKQHFSRRRFFQATGLAAAGLIAGACGKNPTGSQTTTSLLQQPVSPVSG